MNTINVFHTATGTLASVNAGKGAKDKGLPSLAAAIKLATILSLRNATTYEVRDSYGVFCYCTNGEKVLA